MGDLSKYFSLKEFQCKCGCGAVKVSADLLQRLTAVRGQYGRPIIITSGARCEIHNLEVGGREDSSHLKGKAVDILMDDDRERYNLLLLLIKSFSRIGINDGFIHVDVDETKTPNVCWIY